MKRRVILAMILLLVSFLGGCCSILPCKVDALIVSVDKHYLKRINPYTHVAFFIEKIPDWPIRNVYIDFEGDGITDLKIPVRVEEIVGHTYPKGSYTPTFKCGDIEKKLKINIRPYTLDEAVNLFADVLKSYNITPEGSGAFNYTTGDGSEIYIPYLLSFEDTIKILAPKGKAIVVDENVVSALKAILNSNEFPYSTFYLHNGMWRYEIDHEINKYW